MAEVGETVVDEFKELRLTQEARLTAVTAARISVLAAAETEFTLTAEAARTGGDEGREALEAYVAKYDNASVPVGDENADVVVPHVAAARAWLQVYGAEDAEVEAAEHAQNVEVARTEVRDTDILIRRGGEEFVLLMPSTSTSEALPVAERIRTAVSASPISTAGGDVPLTVSIGLATWGEGESASGVEARADAALYRAKAAGRDRTEVSDVD